MTATSTRTQIDAHATPPAPTLMRQTSLIFKRTATDASRNVPLAFVAPTLIAAFIAATFAGVLSKVADTHGFPTDSFLDWIAPGTVLLAAFVGAGYSAGAILRDIETGYFDRLRILPINTLALVFGRALFEAVRIIPPATVVLGGALLLGAKNQGGVGGFLGVIAIAMILAFTWNGIFFLTAIKVQDQAAVAGLQPLFMPVLMFSTFFAPLTGTPNWYKTVSSINPFTPLLNGTRSLLHDAPDYSDLGIGIAAFAALGAVTYTIATRTYLHNSLPD